MNRSGLLDRLNARLAEHYVAPARTLAVELVVSDDAACSCRFVLGEQIGIAPSGDACPAIAARMTLGRALLDAMLADPHGFDPRSAESIALGGVRIEGSARLAAYWLQLLKRPTQAARSALAHARAIAPRSLDAVPSLDASHYDNSGVRTVIADALSRSTPLHVRSAVDWPETRWSLDTWRMREGAVVLRAHPLDGSPQSVADMIDAIAQARADDRPPHDGPYTEGSLLPAGWEERFRLPMFDASMFGRGQLWFGCRREHALVTPLHCDLANSFLVQVHGRKRLRLYPPSQDAGVYALDAFNTFRPCRVDPAMPDFVRFPRFADASGTDVVLAPGDLLAIPTGWFHCVWAIDDVLSVSRFMSDADADGLARSLAPAI